MSTPRALEVQTTAALAFTWSPGPKTNADGQRITLAELAAQVPGKPVAEVVARSLETIPPRVADFEAVREIAYRFKQGRPLEIAKP